MHGLRKLLLFCVLTCVEENALGSEIVHGENVTDKSMLYMASVQNDAGKHICGGFLISKDFVVTAAHCDHPGSVVLGTHNLNNIDKTMRYKVKSCKHPQYKNVKNGYDIMLLKLSTKAKLGARVQLVQLPKKETKLKEKKNCLVAGWGFTETGGKTSTVLNAAEVPIINRKTCEKQWAGLNVPLPKNVICAGGYGTDKGFCQGDSGGPLVCDKKAVGVVSFNMRKNCNYPNVPNIYTDLSKVLPWIRKSLKKGSC